jgi:protein-disulfide isomerase-like protein with CxxC motif
MAKGKDVENSSIVAELSKAIGLASEDQKKTEEVANKVSQSLENGTPG